MKGVVTLARIPAPEVHPLDLARVGSRRDMATAIDKGTRSTKARLPAAPSASAATARAARHNGLGPHRDTKAPLGINPGGPVGSTIVMGRRLTETTTWRQSARDKMASHRATHIGPRMALSNRWLQPITGAVGIHRERARLVGALTDDPRRLIGIIKTKIPCRPRYRSFADALAAKPVQQRSFPSHVKCTA